MESGGRDITVERAVTLDDVQRILALIRFSWPEAIVMDEAGIPVASPKKTPCVWHVSRDRALHDVVESEGVTEAAASHFISIYIEGDGVRFVVGDDGSEGDRLAQEIRAVLASPSEPSTVRTLAPVPEESFESVWLSDEGGSWSARAGAFNFLLTWSDHDDTWVCNCPQLNFWWVSPDDIDTTQREFVTRVHVKVQSLFDDATAALKVLAPEAHARLELQDLNRRIEQLTSLGAPSIDAEIHRLERLAANIIRAKSEARIRPMQQTFDAAMSHADRLLGRKTP